MSSPQPNKIQPDRVGGSPAEGHHQPHPHDQPETKESPYAPLTNRHQHCPLPAHAQQQHHPHANVTPTTPRAVNDTSPLGLPNLTYCNTSKNATGYHSQTTSNDAVSPKDRVLGRGGSPRHVGGVNAPDIDAHGRNSSLDNTARAGAAGHAAEPQGVDDSGGDGRALGGGSGGVARSPFISESNLPNFTLSATAEESAVELPFVIPSHGSPPNRASPPFLSLQQQPLPPSPQSPTLPAGPRAAAVPRRTSPAVPVHTDPNASSSSIGGLLSFGGSGLRGSAVGDVMMGLSPNRGSRYPYWHTQPRFNALSPSLHAAYLGVGMSSPGAISLGTIATPTVAQQHISPVALGVDMGRSVSLRDGSVLAARGTLNSSGAAFYRENSFVAHSPASISSPMSLAHAHSVAAGASASVAATSVHGHSGRIFREAPAQLPLVPPDTRAAPPVTVGDCILESSPHPLPNLSEDSPLLNQLNSSAEEAVALHQPQEDYLAEVANHQEGSTAQSDSTGDSSLHINSAYYQPLRPPFRVEPSAPPSSQAPTPRSARAAAEVMTPIFAATMQRSPLSTAGAVGAAAGSTTTSVSVVVKNPVVGKWYKDQHVTGATGTAARHARQHSGITDTTEALEGDEVPVDLNRTARPGEGGKGEGAAEASPTTRAHATPPDAEPTSQEHARDGTAARKQGSSACTSDTHSSPKAVDVTTMETIPRSEDSPLPEPVNDSESGPLEDVASVQALREADVDAVTHVLTTTDKEPASAAAAAATSAGKRSPGTSSVESDPEFIGSPSLHGHGTSWFHQYSVGRGAGRHHPSNWSPSSLSNILLRPPRMDHLASHDPQLMVSESSAYSVGVPDPRTPANVRNWSAVVRSLGERSLGSTGTPVPQPHVNSQSSFLMTTSAWSTIAESGAGGGISPRYRFSGCVLEELEDLTEAVRLFKSDVHNLLQPIPAYLYGLQSAATDALASLMALQDQLSSTILASRALAHKLGLDRTLWQALRDKCAATSRDTLPPLADEALGIVRAAKIMSSRKRIIATWTVEALSEVFAQLKEINEQTKELRASQSQRAVVPPTLSHLISPAPLPSTTQPRPPSDGALDAQATTSVPSSGPHVVKTVNLHAGDTQQGERACSAPLCAPAATTAAPPAPPLPTSPCPQDRQWGSSTCSRLSATTPDERKLAVAKAADMNVKDLCQWFSGEQQLKTELNRDFEEFVNTCRRKASRVALLRYLLADSMRQGAPDDSASSMSRLHDAASACSDGTRAAQGRERGAAAKRRVSAPDDPEDSADTATTAGGTDDGACGAPRRLSQTKRHQPCASRRGTRSPGTTAGSRSMNEPTKEAVAAGAEAAATGAVEGEKEMSLTPPEGPVIDAVREAEKGFLLDACAEKLFDYIRTKANDKASQSHRSRGGLHDPAMPPRHGDVYLPSLPPFSEVQRHFSDMESNASWSWWYSWLLATQLSAGHRTIGVSGLRPHVDDFLRGNDQAQRLRMMLREDARGRSAGASLWVDDQLRRAERELARLEQKYVSRTRHNLQLMLRRMVLLCCGEYAPCGGKLSPLQGQLPFPASPPPAPTTAGEASVPTQTQPHSPPSPPTAAAVLAARLASHFESVKLAKEELGGLDDVVDRDARNLRLFSEKWGASPSMRSLSVSGGDGAVAGIPVHAIQCRLMTMQSGCGCASCTYCSGEGMYATQEDNVEVIYSAIDAIATAAELLVSVLRRGHRRWRSAADVPFARGDSLTNSSPLTRQSTASGTAPPVPISLLTRRTQSQQTNAFIEDENDDAGRSPEREADFVMLSSRESGRAGHTPVMRNPHAPSLSPFATRTDTADGNRNARGTQWAPRDGASDARQNSIEEQVLGHTSGRGDTAARAPGRRSGQRGAAAKDRHVSTDLFVTKPSTRALNRLQRSLDDLTVSVERNFSALCQ